MKKTRVDRLPFRAAKNQVSPLDDQTNATFCADKSLAVGDSLE